MSKYLITAVLTACVIFISCLQSKDYLEIDYLREGKIDKMRVPFSIIDGKDRLSSAYVRSVEFSILDSINFTDNNPDKITRHSTPFALNFSKPIRKYSPEYYAVYTVWCIDKAGEYYNRLFDGKIDFNSQEEYRNIEITFGDIPYLTTPKGYIFIPGSNPSPSLFYHEMGHRAFWYMESGLGIKFKGLTYMHMGILEYFTVSLNDSPIVGEDALPALGVRDASAFYGYPAHDSLNLGAAMKTLQASYPEEMKNPASNTFRYVSACWEAYSDFLNIGNNHETAMILATTLWRVREKLGQEITDRLVAQTTLDLNKYLDARESFYTPAEWETLRTDRVEWCDFYYGMILMNRELNNGNDEQYITEQFRKTGFPVEQCRFNL